MLRPPVYRPASQKMKAGDNRPAAIEAAKAAAMAISIELPPKVVVLMQSVSAAAAAC